MSVPLTLAVPAAAAGLAYINARTGLYYDYLLIGGLMKSRIKGRIREKWDRLNHFYRLEDHALGKNKDRVLLIFEGRQWTYKEVYEMSLRYGTWFKTKYGVKSKDIVGIDFINSERFIFIWMGLWSIGAKPAFINYNLTSKALTHCIKVSTAGLLLVDHEVQENFTQDVLDALPDVRVEIFTSELRAEAEATVPNRVPNEDRSDDKLHNMAMLIYTSGTTGLPKPAIVSWNKVITGSNIVPWWLHMTSSDIFYTPMPLYHSSASVLGFCMVAEWGATISLGKKFGTKTFWQDVRASKATVIHYVGETCRYLLAAPPQVDPVTGEDLDRKNNVRAAFGNGLRPEIWDRFKERFGIESIGEFYSATEGPSGVWNFSRNDFSKGAIGRFGSIGSLLTGASTAVVEWDLETEQPYRDPETGFCIKIPRIGKPGELLYRLDPDNIPGNFQGYFNNPGSTNGKIMRDVFAKGDAWFRTGDVVSQDNDGRTFWSDRIGDTFRWKAENVSTTEVSEALGVHPLVHEANVYGVELPHHDGRAGCAAIVLADDPSEKFLSELATQAKKTLPRYAVPLFLRRLKKMQITGTNKQQKHILRSEGVDPAKVGEDELFWLKDGTYVRFGGKEWSELNSGSVKL